MVQVLASQSSSDLFWNELRDGMVLSHTIAAALLTLVK